MQAFFSALGFLTIIPVPQRWQGDEHSLARSVVWFPFVGLILGLIWMVCGLAFHEFFPNAIAAALLLLLLQLFSGGLHIDGLADTADGFFSSRNRERMLEIMRDSRSGPMGVAAIVFMLILQFAALDSLPERYQISALVLAPIAGRCALVFGMTLLRYARPTGIVSIFAPRSRWYMVYAVGFLLLVAALFERETGLFAALGTLVVLALYCRLCQVRIGGFTGDTLGAGCILAETVFLLLLSAKPVMPVLPALPTLPMHL